MKNELAMRLFSRRTLTESVAGEQITALSDYGGGLMRPDKCSSRAGARLRGVAMLLAMLRLYDYIPFEATCAKTTLVPPSHSVHATGLIANFPKLTDQSLL